MKKKAVRWGIITQVTVLGGLITFCLRSNMIKTKVFLGVLYMYWGTHIHAIGNHLGMLVYTPWACRQLNMGLEYETGRITNKFITELKERQAARERGEKVLNDSKFQQAFYIELAGEDSKKFFNKSYTANDYFTKNFDKYVKKEGENDPHRVFNPLSDYEEDLRLRYFDCFVTRYVYYNFTRWTHRLMMFLGIKEDI